MPKLGQLSAASQRVLSKVPTSSRDVVKRRLRKLENELALHRAASIALVVADAKGEADSHTDWNDVDAARELAENALGAKEVASIRKQVREELGGGEDEFEDEDDEAAE